MELTRVYQNQPSQHQNQQGNRNNANQDAPVQVSTQSTPKAASGSAVLQNTQLEENVKESGPKPDDMDQNWILEDQRTRTHRRPAKPGFGGNGAIWVTEVTEQPGFLFPVAQTTSLPTIRKQITEEASLSAWPQQVVS